jgi:hypothetical protein
MPNGDIFVIGGLQGENPLKTCFQINQDNAILERAPMETMRHSLATALIRDRFILAIGGL